MAAESMHGSKAGEISEDEAQRRSNKLYNFIAEKMNEKSGQECREESIPRIYKVPESLRKLKESAYTPRVVSIGPVHGHDERLKVMQDHKVGYMCSLFHRMIKLDEAHKDDRLRETLHDLGNAKSDSLFDRMIKLDETRKDNLLPETALRDCGNAMLGSISRARTCYAESFQTKYCDIEFAKMMLVDGCFILEFLFRYRMWLQKDTDPIYGNSVLRKDIRHDLLLLENQIPFFVLQQLFELTLQNIQNHRIFQFYNLLNFWLGGSFSLTNLVLGYFGNMMNETRNITDKAGTDETPDHILGLLHKCYQPQDPGDFDSPVQHSATDIVRAGVSFKVSEGEDYLLVDFRTCCFNHTTISALSKILPSWLRHTVGFPFHILYTCLRCTTKTICQISSSCLCCTCFMRSSAERQPDDAEANKPNSSRSSSARNQRSLSNNCCSFFWLCQLCCGRSLEIPKLCVYDSTESFLRNLIAYEQCCPDIPGYITSYALLMDTLVNTKEDVELLVKAQVLENHLGASEDASVLFNNLCKEVSPFRFYFANPWKQLDEYCDRCWHRNLASLRGTYFSNPWSFISLIAGLVLFALTITQTIYTVRSSN